MDEQLSTWGGMWLSIRGGSTVEAVIWRIGWSKLPPRWTAGR